ncbi:MAG: Cytochrome c4 [Steroidobacteraceae bacterium]|nr:Cytochrome c4 [Steroidobacteraceae bacterium]
MTKIPLALAAISLAVAAPAAFADGSAEAGAAKSTVCIACHGPGGNSVNPEWPNLAGQNAAYIAEQLRQFRAGQRAATPNAMVMTAQAASLSDEDIADLGAYFASQTPTGLEADPSYWKAGEALYRGGSHERGIPACMACHGPVGRGNPAAGYPALRAQHSVYTVEQLTAYAKGSRYDDAAGAAHDTKNAHMMETIAKQLTPEDIRDLASYIQGMR